MESGGCGCGESECGDAHAELRGQEWMKRLGGCIYDITDISMQRRGDENVRCTMLKVGLYVYIRTIANRSIDDNDEL